MVKKRETHTEKEREREREIKRERERDKERERENPHLNPLRPKGGRRGFGTSGRCNVSFFRYIDCIMINKYTWLVCVCTEPPAERERKPVQLGYNPTTTTKKERVCVLSCRVMINKYADPPPIDRVVSSKTPRCHQLRRNCQLLGKKNER